jgi:hypothetical protein
MARVVGEADGYRFVLAQANGRYDQESYIWLPSVTRIIKRILHSEALSRWKYTVTRDNVSGLLSTLLKEYEGQDAAFREMIEEVFCDYETLEEFLKQNQARPDDVASDAAESRGRPAHDFLEALARAQQESTEGADVLAKKVYNRDSSWMHAIAGWWLTTQPVVEASEKVVWTLEPHGGYAGTLDLVWKHGPVGPRTLTDLKTRGLDGQAYESDEAQGNAYGIALKAMGGPKVDRRSILVAREDGTYVEHLITQPDKVFLNLLEIHSLLYKKGGTGPKVVGQGK